MIPQPQFEHLLIARDLNERCYLSIKCHEEIDHEIVGIFNDYMKYNNVISESVLFSVLTQGSTCYDYTTH